MARVAAATKPVVETTRREPRGMTADHPTTFKDLRNSKHREQETRCITPASQP
jgi:hypothetical protein